MKITRRQLRRLIREEKAKLMREQIEYDYAGSSEDRADAIRVLQNAIITMRSLAEAPGAAAAYVMIGPDEQEMLAADVQDLERVVLGYLRKLR